MYRGLTLHVRVMYRDITGPNERNIQWTDISCERNIQGTDSFLQDGDYTDGYYIALFAEQLTRTFEVLVFVHAYLNTSMYNIHTMI